MSVLFADLVGSTAMAEALDPEDVDAVLRRYFAAVSGVVVRHGGEVEKFIGDAVVAAFGVHADVEDAAVRAVAAAVAVRDAVADLATELVWLDRPLEVRVGVNTGEVVVSDDGDGWRLAGDAVNVAARLQAAASPGEVVVGAETALAVAPSVAVDALPPQQLAGKRDPVRAWRVRHAEPAARVLPAPPLIGRDAEVAAIAAALRADGGLHLVVATPGLGRSRLLSAVAASVGDRPSVTFAARPEPGDRPYAVVADLFTEAVSALMPGEPPTVALERLAAASSTPAATLGLRLAAQLLGDETTDLPRGERFAAWHAALDVLLPAPTVVIVDDLHLAPPDARSFLVELAAGGPAGHAVLASARAASLVTAPTGQAAPSNHLADRADRRWHLAPLPDDAVAALIDAAVGRDVLPTHLRAAVVASASGTPLFVVELLRRWWVEGRLVPVGDGWRLTDEPSQTLVPSTIQALYTGELDRLPTGPREVVSIASVPGVRFPVDALPSLGVDTPAGVLISLVDAGLLDPTVVPAVTGTGYAFRQPLLRDAAYGELLRSDRADLHRRYARWLADAGNPVHGVDAEVARHLEAAVTAVLHAGDDAERRALAEEAAERWEHAARVDLVPAPERAADRIGRALALAGDDAGRWALLGDALGRTGAFATAVDAHARSAELASTPTERADAALAHERALLDGRLDRASLAGSRSEDLLTAALADDHDDARRAELLAARGQARAWRDGPVAGEEDRRTSTALARAVGRPDTLAAVLLAARASRRRPEQVEERLADAREAADAAASTGDDEVGFEADRSLLVDLWTVGAPAVDTNTVRERAVARVERLRQPSRWWYPPMWSAAEALRAGDLDTAQGAIEELSAAGAAGRYRDVAAVVLAQQVQLDRERGVPDRAGDRLAPAFASDPPRWAALTAAAAAWAGDLARARRAATVHLAVGLTSVFDDLARAWNLAHLAEVAVALDEPGWAATVRRALAPYGGQVVVVGAGALVDGAVDRRLGQLALLAGDGDDAGWRRDAAIAVETRSGAGPALARTHALLGRRTVATPEVC